MYSLDYLDESVIDEAKKQFLRVYPEFRPIPIGASQDREAVIIQCHFPDGTFYFRVTYNSVSNSYDSKEAADRAH